MKVAWFQGDIERPETEWVNGGRAEFLSMEQILALPFTDPRRPCLRLLLVPDDFDLAQMWGDDWNDAPADCNAGEPYDDTLPPGAKWVTLGAGDYFPGT